MFVAACSTFSFSLLIMAMRAAEEPIESITPTMIVFVALYLLLTPIFSVYLPLGPLAGLAWPLVLAGGTRRRVVLRGAVLGLTVAAVVGTPLGCLSLTRPIPVVHRGEPPPSRGPIRELITAELSLISSCDGGYAGWAWLTSRRLPDRRKSKKEPPWPDV